MRKRTSLPTPRELAKATRVLENYIPMHEKPKLSWRYSDRGTPNLRFSTITGDQSWYVDIYAGQFFCVRVGDRPTETMEDYRSLVYYICRMLGVSVKSGD